uniref:Uncharacterized protein n=1 Tax=Rhizophora mucronata TaxID=61149 RepID=A0A2P2KC30_RHIMU
MTTPKLKFTGQGSRRDPLMRKDWNVCFRVLITVSRNQASRTL